MKKFYLKRPLLLVVSLMLILNSCRKEEEFEAPDSITDAVAERYPPQIYNSDVAQQWYALLLQLIKDTPGHTPPVSARDLGYTGIALYQSVAAGVQGHKSLAGQLSGLSSVPSRLKNKHYVPVATANAALARIIKYMMANATAANLARIDSLEAANEQYYTSLFDGADLMRSVDFGHAVADAIYNWSVSDGGHQAYLDLFPSSYVPPAGPGMWTPTGPLFQSAMLPYWGSTRIFVPANSNTVNPPAPPAWSTSAGSSMHTAAMEVYTTVNNLTQAQKDIANFWSNGGGTFTPPGHNIAITAQLIRNEDMNLRDAAILLAKVGVSQHDAAVVCWRAKFTYNLMRPVTYIKTYIDASWNSFIPTPPFPSYTSGHSTLSAAAGKILTNEFGSNYAFTDSTKIPLGFPARSYASIEQSAQEAAVSRLYGGIHYTFDNVKGYDCGTDIALNIEKLKW